MVDESKGAAYDESDQISIRFQAQLMMWELLVRKS